MKKISLLSLESKLPRFGLHENALFANPSNIKPCELRLNEAGNHTIYCELQFNVMQYMQKLNVFFTKILTDCIASDLKVRKLKIHIDFSKVSCFTVENKTMQNPAFSVELTT